MNTDANPQIDAQIDAQSLTVSIDAQTLLKGVDLHAKRGQFIGLIGPNGAGKSTLLRTLAGVLPVQLGSVWLGGAEMSSMSARSVAETLALVPQIAPATSGFTALELVLMGRYPHLGRFQVEGSRDHQIASSAMQQTETVEFEQRTLDTLSGGERQRVFLARALAQEPQILLLDEPTANLDILHQLTILSLVRTQVDEGLTAIAAIHDLSLAARFCDRLVLLHHGSVIANDEPCEVLTPDLIATAFGVESAVYRDPVSGAIAISLIGPLNGKQRALVS